MQPLFPASLVALALGAPIAAAADPSSDLAALRSEIETLRAAYEARLQALEQRLQKAEQAAAAPAASAAAASVPAVPAAAATPYPDSTAPAAASAKAGANAFNPALSLILSGIYAHTSRNPANYAATGLQLPPGAQVGPGTRGFSLAESELGFAASVDPWFRGEARISLLPDDSVSVEEAFVQTTALVNGLSLKAGRFYSGIGYLNPQHSHTWDFVDNPLAYQALLGTQYGDDGVQLSWLAPLDRYLEFGAELGRGRSFPGSDTGRNGAGMSSLFAHSGGDIGDSQSWRAGLSVLNAKATDQELLSADAAGRQATNAFSGSTRVFVADAVWKWAPDGNATRTSFKLQGEYLRSTRSGSLVYDPGSADSRNAAWRAVQSGWYLQGVWQFMPRWRVGLRTERLYPDTQDFAANLGAFAGGGFQPSKNTLMLDFSPSEFSRVRLQFARDRSREGLADNQFFVQYQMSLGAHGAHSY